ncbi:MAG: hypothetical protein RLZZ44_5 [Bacteroidota bacterium]
MSKTKGFLEIDKTLKPHYKTKKGYKNIKPINKCKL